MEPPRTVRLQAADMEHYVGLTQAIHDAGRFALLELSGAGAGLGLVTLWRRTITREE